MHDFTLGHKGALYDHKTGGITNRVPAIDTPMEGSTDALQMAVQHWSGGGLCFPGHALNLTLTDHPFNMNTNDKRVFPPFCRPPLFSSYLHCSQHNGAANTPKVDLTTVSSDYFLHCYKSEWTPVWRWFLVSSLSSITVMLLIYATHWKLPRNKDWMDMLLQMKAIRQGK